LKNLWRIGNYHNPLCTRRNIKTNVYNTRILPPSVGEFENF
jgi:hypothetical protein